MERTNSLFDYKKAEIATGAFLLMGLAVMIVGLTLTVKVIEYELTESTKFVRFQWGAP